MLIQSMITQLLLWCQVLGLRKDNPSMADFWYNSNATRNQNNFKAIVNGNVADSGMIALTNLRILICWYQGVMLRNNMKLFREFFINFSEMIRKRLRLLASLKVNFYSGNFKKNKYLWDGWFSILLLWKSVSPYIQISFKTSWNLFLIGNTVAYSSKQLFISVPQNCCTKSIGKFPKKVTHVSFLQC